MATDKDRVPRKNKLTFANKVESSKAKKTAKDTFPSQNMAHKPTEKLVTHSYKGKHKTVEENNADFALRDQTGKPTMYIAELEDFTERKKAEEKIKMAAEEWLTTFNSVTDLIVVIDINHRITRLNKAVSTFLKLPEEKITGHYCYEIMHGATQPPSECPLTKLWESKKSEESELYLKDKKIWAQVTVDPIFNGKGEMSGVVHVIRDITERKRVEEALKESEANFRASMENSPLGIRIVSEEGETLYTNYAFLNIYGYRSLEEFNFTPVKDRYTPGSYVEFQERREKRRRHEPLPENYGVDIVRKNGEVRNLQVMRKKILWGGKAQYQTIYQDITEHKQAEAALRLSEEQYRTTVQNAPVGIATSNSDKHFLSANNMFCQILGYTESELKQLTFKDITHPEDLAESINLMQAIDTGKMPSFSQEKRYVKKDGNLIIGKIVVSALRDQTGKPTMYIAELEDFTAYSRTERALYDSEIRYRRLFETARDGILIQDAITGAVTDVNPFLIETLGFPRDEILGKSVWELGCVKDPKIVKDLFMELQNKGYVRYDDLPLETADGRRVDVEFIANVYNVDNQKVIQCNIRNITERNRVEKALKESEQNFRNSLDNSTMGIRIIDARGHILYWNQAFLNIFGYENIGEIRKIPLQERLTLDGYANYLKQKENALKGDPIPDKSEIDIIRKDGSMRHLEVFRKEVLWYGKTQYQTIYNDISEHKKAEQALQESEKNLRNTLDSSPMGIYIIDANLNTLYANQKLLDIFGYQNLDEIRTSPLDEHYTPGSRIGLAQRRERYLRGESNPDHFELDIVRKDGLIRHLQVYRKEILWGSKKQRQIIYEDITERKQAEEALYASEVSYRRLFESAKDGILIINAATGLITDANPYLANLLGISVRELIGEELWQIGTFKDIVSNKEKFQELLEKKYVRYEDLLLKTADGREISVEFVSNLYEVDHRKVIQCNIRNITDRKQAEKEKQELQEKAQVTSRLAAVGEMAAGIAHEINNPLTGVLVSPRCCWKKTMFRKTLRII